MRGRQTLFQQFSQKYSKVVFWQLCFSFFMAVRI